MAKLTVKKANDAKSNETYYDKIERLKNQTSAHELYPPYTSVIASIASGATIKDLMPFPYPEYERAVIASFQNDPEAMKEYKNHITWRYKAVRKIFRNKNIISIIILIITVSLLVFGCVMSYKQLTDPILQESPQSQTEINLFRVIHFKSSIAGIVILGFSFLFFYMYLKHVFTKVSEPPIYLGEIMRETTPKIHKETEDNLLNNQSGGET